MNKLESILVLLVVMVCCGELSACKPAVADRTDVAVSDSTLLQPDEVSRDTLLHSAVYSRVDSIVIETVSELLCCTYVLTPKSAYVIEDFYKDSVVLAGASKWMLEEHVYHLFILKDSTLRTNIGKDVIVDLPWYSVACYKNGKKVVNKRVIPGEDAREHTSYANELYDALLRVNSCIKKHGGKENEKQNYCLCRFVGDDAI